VALTETDVSLKRDPPTTPLLTIVFVSPSEPNSDEGCESRDVINCEFMTAHKGIFLESPKRIAHERCAPIDKGSFRRLLYLEALRKVEFCGIFVDSRALQWKKRSLEQPAAKLALWPSDLDGFAAADVEFGSFTMPNLPQKRGRNRYFCFSTRFRVFERTQLAWHASCDALASSASHRLGFGVNEDRKINE
jgi:hypothetical protein